MKSTFTLITLSLIVLATLIYGFIDGGSPQAARNKKLDETRYSNIQSIQYSINSYYRKHASLPILISEAIDEYSGKLDLLDPLTKKPYEYVITGNSEYKLCATFVTDTTKDSMQKVSKISHPSGRYCYSFQAQD